MERKSVPEQVILDGIVVCGQNWDERVLALPESFTEFASNDVFANMPRLRSGNPILDAPVNCSRGGLCFFDATIPRVGFNEMLFSMGIAPGPNKYAAFYKESEYPEEERCYSQLKIVTVVALFEYYKAICDADCREWKPQLCDIRDAMWRFICQEDIRHGVKKNNLPGLELGFGFMVERNIELSGGQMTSGVYRIWSRPVRKGQELIE